MASGCEVCAHSMSRGNLLATPLSPPVLAELTAPIGCCYTPPLSAARAADGHGDAPSLHTQFKRATMNHGCLHIERCTCTYGHTDSHVADGSVDAIFVPSHPARASQPGAPSCSQLVASVSAAAQQWQGRRLACDPLGVATLCPSAESSRSAMKRCSIHSQLPLSGDRCSLSIARRVTTAMFCGRPCSRGRSSQGHNFLRPCSTDCQQSAYPAAHGTSPDPRPSAHVSCSTQDLHAEYCAVALLDCTLRLRSALELLRCRRGGTCGVQCGRQSFKARSLLVHTQSVCTLYKGSIAITVCVCVRLCVAVSVGYSNTRTQPHTRTGGHKHAHTHAHTHAQSIGD